jgi:plasmid stabilization system protein ParE
MSTLKDTASGSAPARGCHLRADPAGAGVRAHGGARVRGCSQSAHRQQLRNAAPDQDVVELNWTVEARRWLKDIFDYIVADNPAAAARVVEGIYDKVQLLRSFPDIGYHQRVTSFPLVGNHESGTRVGANMQAEATVQGDDISIPHAQRDAPSALLVGSIVAKSRGAGRKWWQPTPQGPPALVRSPSTPAPHPANAGRMVRRRMLACRN